MLPLDHSDVHKLFWGFGFFTLILKKITDMGYETLSEMADAIIKAGGGKALIISAMRSVHGQGYESGYKACTYDLRRARQSQDAVARRAFSREMDIVDDVMKSKWQ